MLSDEIAAERSLRFELWRELNRGNIANIQPGLLRDKRVYGGAQGIWVDKARTEPVSEDGNGVTMAILHTGRHYPDDLSEDGAIYHYPSTNRGPNRDANEIAATQNAYRYELPIFVILPGQTAKSKRHVKIGWVEDWDDLGRLFLITFGDTPPKGASPPTQDEPFNLTDDGDRGTTTAKTRKRQERFRFQVLQQYGHKCAVCNIKLPQLLIAAHIRGKADKGSDDWRNGLPLCGTHHDAFDLYLFGIVPETLQVEVAPTVTRNDLSIVTSTISTIRAEPHRDALNWRWKRTQKTWTSE